MYSGTGTIGTHTCSGTGTEVVSVSPALSDGDYSLTYTETDISGNQSENSPSLNTTIDTTAPVI